MYFINLIVLFCSTYSTFTRANVDDSHRNDDRPSTHIEVSNLIVDLENRLRNAFENKLKKHDDNILEYIKLEISRNEKENIENIKKCLNDTINKENVTENKTTNSNTGFLIQSFIEVLNKRAKCESCKGCKNGDICFYRLLLIFISLLSEPDKIELQKSLSIFSQLNTFNLRQSNLFGIQPNINPFISPFNQNSFNLNQTDNIFPQFLGLQNSNLGTSALLNNLLLNSVFNPTATTETNICDRKKPTNSVTPNYGPSVQTNNPILTSDPICPSQNLPNPCPNLISHDNDVYSPKVQSNNCNSYGPAPPSFVTSSGKCRKN